jgi:hypothetical protein
MQRLPDYCENEGCSEFAVGCDADGYALCVDCLTESKKQEKIKAEKREKYEKLLAMLTPSPSTDIPPIKPCMVPDPGCLVIFVLIALSLLFFI